LLCRISRLNSAFLGKISTIPVNAGTSNGKKKENNAVPQFEAGTIIDMMQEPMLESVQRTVEAMVHL